MQVYSRKENPNSNFVQVQDSTSNPKNKVNTVPELSPQTSI